MRAYERFLTYAAIRTPSDENSTTSPSSKCQFELADLLKDEMLAIGIADAHVTEYCYVYGTIPATPGLESKPKIGFIAHMDTVSDYCDHDIKPIVHENYDGGDLALGTSGRTLSVKDFPHLPSLKGRTLITTDGTTVLGADDKAGIAEIMTMAERLIKENIPHGTICIAFTPDEEVGAGTAHFDVEKFGADFAYTLDGDSEGEIQYENFNACKADFEITGFGVHPGSSKDTMINACLVAMEINQMLPGCETPRGTEDYEGFFHLTNMSGDVTSAELHYIIRDHDKDYFEMRKNTLRLIEKDLNAKWGEGTVKLTITEQYKNMSEIIAGCMHLIENAKQACVNANVAPQILPIRGGTDGCQLSFKGLPCPNLGTGGHAYHGPYEHITVEGMDQATDIVLELVKIYAK
ncbi:MULTISPECIES: peptidase T [Lachnospiraceae]|uniref:peptidase T n=1 Tax=Lachnospiraceae TaxID=186803 RepID=UPI002A3162AB|nr:peptidase T [bacterium]MDY2886490.1 peptidase T [Bariatricus sp.]MDD6514521.1 peptidase T [bacterium]MDD7144202.1 peptidase T [bacterium]MDY4194390.1 peptidase T [Bariatricus sp.]